MQAQSRIQRHHARPACRQAGFVERAYLLRHRLAVFGQPGARGVDSGRTMARKFCQSCNATFFNSNKHLLFVT